MGDRMRSEQEYILTVYEKGSFSKAAQALYLTQPALSIAIQKVEAEIVNGVLEKSSSRCGCWKTSCTPSFWT